MVKRILISVSVLSLLLAVAVIISLCLGSSVYSPSDILKYALSGSEFETECLIVFQIRLPRVCAAVLTGAGLAASGAAFQALLRNPLADPYIVGTSSGASLGAAIAVILNISAVGFFSPVIFFAFAGAAAVMFCVYAVSVRAGRLSVETFLLSGVIAGSFCGALVSFMMTVAGEDLPHIVWWLMGGFSGREDWNYVLIMLPYIFAGCVVLISYSPSLNLLSMGEDIALSRGVNVERVKFIVICAASLLTAVSVSIAGTIGFVGFMIPHVMRRLFGSEHRVLMAASVLGGAVFLVLADTLSRCLLPFSSEIPVGVITSLCGAPFFFFVLKKYRE